MRSQTTRRPAKADKNQKLRVKNEPPTMAEAMLAATGMSDEPSQQIELAAMLMGLPLTAEVAKALSAARPRGNVVDINTRSGVSRTLVVEKKRVVRPMTNAAPVAPRAFAGKLRLGARI